MFNVWSSHRPVLYRDVYGRNRLAGGTIAKIQYNGVNWPIVIPLPRNITLGDIHWVPNVPESRDEYIEAVVPNRPYVIRTYRSGRRECTCPGFQYRKKCKHTA